MCHDGPMWVQRYIFILIFLCVFLIFYVILPIEIQWSK